MLFNLKVTLNETLKVNAGSVGVVVTVCVVVMCKVRCVNICNTHLICKF